MTSGMPIIRQASWFVALPSILVLLAVMGLGRYLGGSAGMLVAVACYILYSRVARSLISREHRAGVRLARRKRFAEAIAHFEKSLAFFERHQWLDDWRGLVLLSSSRASYREMALLNTAFCHGQLGEGSLAAATYRRCLQLFPGSGMAEAALRMIESVQSGT